MQGRYYPMQRPDIADPPSVEAQDLIKHMLVVSPVDRFSMAEVLAHPWFDRAVPLEDLQAAAGPHMAAAVLRTTVTSALGG
jgi:serine/threonine protein kinase